MNIITFEGREDEMLTFHKDGKYWMTLYSTSPTTATELEQWLKAKPDQKAAEILRLQIERLRPCCSMKNLQPTARQCGVLVKELVKALELLQNPQTDKPNE